MKCLENYIGIRVLTEKCGAPPSVSGLYLEDLEGLNHSRLAQVEYGKWQNAKDFFDQLTMRAGRTLLEEIKVHLMPYVTQQPFTSFGTLGAFDSSKTCDNTSLTIQSCIGNLQRFVIQKLQIKMVEAGTYTITLTDGDHTETKEITVEAGKVTELPWHYVAQSNIVTFSTTGEGYVGTLKSMYHKKGRNKCSDCFCNSGIGRICGISASYTVQCDITEILCAALPHLNMPYLYSVGIEVLKEWLASDRLNFMTIHGKEWAAEKLDEWTFKRNEFIQTSIGGIAKILQGTDRKCVNCGGYSYGYTHP